MLRFKYHNTTITIGLVVCLNTAMLATHAQEPAPSDESLERGLTKTRPYSPYAERNFPTKVLRGDTHLHTMLSFDAGSFGVRLMPDDAYRFAKGEQVTASTGQPVRLSRPLDFLVVSDHSDNMGFFPLMLVGDPRIVGNEQGKRFPILPSVSCCGILSLMGLVGAMDPAHA